jgi:hypothetical protein
MGGIAAFARILADFSAFFLPPNKFHAIGPSNKNGPKYRACPKVHVWYASTGFLQIRSCKHRS